MTAERVHPADARLHLPVDPAADAPDAYPAFGLATYYGEVIAMLRFRLADDSWWAYPYYALGEMSYDPALGIELQFHSSVVCIRGRNLFPSSPTSATTPSAGAGRRTGRPVYGRPSPSRSSSGSSSGPGRRGNRGPTPRT